MESSTQKGASAQSSVDGERSSRGAAQSTPAGVLPLRPGSAFEVDQ